MLKVRPPSDEWYPGQYAEMSAAIEKLRREDPEYDKAWRDGLQRMADEWDAIVAQRVYSEIARDRFFAVLNMEQRYE